jgi:acyl carrier protein|tara:strand:+ start:1397 stop:1609 length:213 start_codon:yes stop_codon:yes gene_type:complete
MKEELLNKIAELLEVDEIIDKDDLSSFDEWDSLTALSIIALVDSDYNKTLSNDQLKQFSSVGDLTTYILE